jgi:hypothetical protein
MELKDIMAISGKPGLYKFVAQGRNAIIVEHIETGKRTSAFTTERINSLEEITVFTNEKDLPLKDVFRAIYDKEDGKETLSPKSDGTELKAYFEEVVPDYDREKVYVSDIKKILSWYNLLQKADLLSFEEEEEKTEETEETEETGGTGEKES